ncbi:MBL fold metallo-hydrolase [bacterium]|nr:MAG: MBL fold metallo-hydrolase [bacterium]
MKLTFLGTGTSMGVPVAGGFSFDKESSDPRDFRYRVSAWVQTEQTSVLIDIGPEFRFQTLRSGIKQIDLVLVTHEHTDHIGGLDDLRPFNYAQRSSIPVITLPRCKEAIYKRFYYMFGPNKTPGSVDVEFLNAKEFQPFVFKDLRITPFPVLHGNMPIWGFKINDLVYITDASAISEKTIELIKNCKILVMSALRLGPKHPTHFTIPEALEIVEKISPDKTYFIHMNSQVKHAEHEHHLPENVFFAHDCLVLEL